MNHYCWSELTIGHCESFSVTITADMLEQFHQITQDNSPIHIQKDYAQMRGFDDCVVYGMLTASFFSTLIGVYLPGEHALLQKIDTIFIHPVYIGDILTITGEIIQQFDAYHQITIRAKITNQHQQKVVRAKIQAGIRED